MSRFLDGLNPKQREVAKTLEGPVLALAGAGTGKTHTVIARIANIIGRGTPPSNILAVTFTNKAAGELKERLKKTLGKSIDLSEMIASTFHSLCVQIIRRDAKVLGYKKAFSIADQSEQYSIIRKAARHVHGCSKLKPEDMMGEISKLKSRGISYDQFALRAIDEWELSLASVYRKYQEALKLRNTMDFDDLLIKSLELLQKHSPAREYWQNRFKYIIVDEFQDTSEIQNKLVSLLAQKWKNICVVGDDDQSIYSWRGAVPENILNFHHKWAGAKVVYLEENYRSTNNILKAANAVIGNNTQRHQKTLWSSLGDGVEVRLLEMQDQQFEAEYIVNEIKRRIRDDNFKGSDFAVIVRANALTRTFEAELNLEKIPYEVIGGQSFFDRKEVRDILSYLSVVDNPDDDGSLLRIINTPARGIGEKTVEKLGSWAAAHSTNIMDALFKASEIGYLAPAAQQACLGFAAQIRRWRNIARTPAVDNLVETIIGDVDYHEEIEHLYDDPLMRSARMEIAYDVGESLRQGMKNGSMSAFLQDAMLSWREKSEKKKDEESVKLITIHSAKGLEYPIVYIAGVEEQIIPHRNSEEEGTVDEERRLLYVAMTRARRELTLSRCINRLVRGKPSKRDPSRFLLEIPQELLKRESTKGLDDDEKEEVFASINAMLADL